MKDINIILDEVKKTLDTARQRNEIAGLMARLAMGNPDEPCEANVEVGDELILIEDNGAYRALSVSEVGLVGVYAGNIYEEYCDAVIKKPKELVRSANMEINRFFEAGKHSPLSEGTYLIGGKAKKKIDRLFKCNPSAN